MIELNKVYDEDYLDSGKAATLNIAYRKTDSGKAATLNIAYRKTG